MPCPVLSQVQGVPIQVPAALKILHVPFGYFPDPIGGTEIYVHGLARGLNAQGIECLVVAPGATAEVYSYDQVAVRRFPVATNLDLCALYGEGDAAAAVAFGRILNTEQPDLVHVHAFTSAVSLRLIRLIKRRGLPVVFTYHTPTVSCQRGTLLRWGQTICDGRLDRAVCTACALHSLGVNKPLSHALGVLPPAVGRGVGRLGLAGGPWTALRMSELVALRQTTLRALLAESDAIVTLCEWTRDLVLRLGVEPQKVHVSRHGLSNNQLARDGTVPRANQGTLRLVFLGRLDPIKGVDVLIRAVRKLPEVALQLDVYGVTQAGGEAYGSHLQQFAQGDARMRFFPPVSNSAVQQLLVGYDVLAVPSQCLETGPLVVLEAFAAGVPVLGSRLGGIAELVYDGVDGLLAEAGDVMAWAAAIRRLATEPALLAQLRAGVRPPRTLAEVVDDMLRLYGQLCCSGEFR